MACALRTRGGEGFKSASGGRRGVLEKCGTSRMSFLGQKEDAAGAESDEERPGRSLN